MNRGELFILSAPSGAGKTTLIQRLFSGPMALPGGLAFSVSHTTRRPRNGETDGREYHFVDPARFASMVEKDEFLEWAKVHENSYGTSNAEVFPRLEAGIDVLLDIDVQGAERVAARHPAAHSIFLMPPSYQDLGSRLRGRALDGAAEIAGRLAVSLWEIRRYERYRYVIINDDADRAARALASIILEKRQVRDRQRERVQSIVADFERAVSAERSHSS
ncbi:MAG: guanylate kinase [Acidobacteriota bacterium]